MKMERYEYFNKDIPMLRKDIFFRFLFMFLFLGIFVWQLFLLVSLYINNNLTTTNIIISTVLLISSLMLAIISFSYAFKNLNIIQKVTLHGSAVKSISIISNAKKNSFLKIYSVIMELISIVMLILMCSAITYNILEYVYFTKISYYLPFLLFVAISGFNSVYHLKTEIKTIKNVREYHSIF